MPAAPVSTRNVSPFSLLRYGGSPDFLPGVVTSVEDGVSVNFDAGWHGASIPLAHIRRPSANRNSSLPVSGPRAGHAPSLSDGARIRAMGSILDLDVGSLGGDTFSQGEQVIHTVAISCYPVYMVMHFPSTSFKSRL